MIAYVVNSCLLMNGALASGVETYIYIYIAERDSSYGGGLRIKVKYKITREYYLVYRQ